MSRSSWPTRIGEHPLVQRAIGLLPRQTGPPRSTAGFGRDIGPAPLAQDSQSVTKRLYERMSDEEVAEVQKRAEGAPELGAIPLELTERRPLALHYGMWLGLPFVAQRTGLVFDQPPEHVHTMARGPLAAAGGLHEADMVVNALRSVGADVAGAGSALDFGCSSGRVVRVLAAAYPEVHWRGCDPNELAIQWAREHLGAIDFFVNAQQPPLPIEEAALGLVYAISIWSHFAPMLGLRWFDDMHRLLAPGGNLVFTSHGLQSLAFHVQTGMRSPEQAQTIQDALYRQGYWYAAEFGQAGDSGVVNPQWGTAFLSPEWILTYLCPRWRVLEFAPGRNQQNQDVYVLQRV